MGTSSSLAAGTHPCLFFVSSLCFAYGGVLALVFPTLPAIAASFCEVSSPRNSTAPAILSCLLSLSACINTFHS